MGSTLSQTFHLSIPVLSSKTTKTLVSFSTIHSKYLLEDNDDSNFSREMHPNPLSQTWLSISSAVGNTSSVHIICSSPSDWDRLVFLFPASLFPSCLHPLLYSNFEWWLKGARADSVSRSNPRGQVMLSRRIYTLIHRAAHGVLLAFTQARLVLVLLSTILRNWKDNKKLI